MASELLNLKGTVSQTTLRGLRMELLSIKLHKGQSERFKCLWQFCPLWLVCCPPVCDPPAETTALSPSAVLVTSAAPSFHTVWSRWSFQWRQHQTARSEATPPRGVSVYSWSSWQRPRTPLLTRWATMTSCGCLQASCCTGNLFLWQQKEGGRSPWRGWRPGTGGGYPGQCTGWGKGSDGHSLLCTLHKACSVSCSQLETAVMKTKRRSAKYYKENQLFV